MRVLVTGGTIVTLNKTHDVLTGDLLIEDGRIASIGGKTKQSCDITIQAQDQFVIPGFVQAHVHLCQTLFRGLADDLSLLDWLKKKIIPMESSHTVGSIRASALLGCLEMQKSGTTSILDMASVRHTQSLIEAVAASGIRYWGGKCLMDFKKYSGPLYQNTKDTLRETEELLSEWRNKNPLIHYAICPRFAVSCTDELLHASAELRQQHDLVLHTHASENRDEVAVIRKRSGLGNVDFLAKLKLLSNKTVVAHGIHVSNPEIRKLVQHRSSVTHCPSSNLKLGSGIAQIERYRKAKLNVAFGADGAACNNMLDPFMEMRLAALLQKPIFGPKALPARVALEMATMGGARALGQQNEIGSLEIGKRADLVTVDRSHPSVATVDDPYSALVYSCTGRDVVNVVVNGQVVVRNREHQLLDEGQVIAEAKAELRNLLARV